MKLKLNSFILFVDDVELLQQFYTTTLGFQLLETSPGWVLLDAGGVTIGLHQVGEAYRNSETQAGETNTKMVFETSEDLHQLREQLLQRQVVLGELKTFPNYPYWLCDGKDPEGNVFQLKQAKL